MVPSIVNPTPAYPTVPPSFARWFHVDYDGTGDPLAHRWPVRRLTATERATARFVIDWDTLPPEDAQMTVAGNAAIRLRAHSTRGRLMGRSARALAAELWDVFCGTGPTPKYPWRGWEVLCAMDAAADIYGVAVWLDTAPLPGDSVSYRRVRLSQRMKELGA